jgi:hypothetical protein
MHYNSTFYSIELFNIKFVFHWAQHFVSFQIACGVILLAQIEE